MPSIKDEAKAYEPSKTKNIADLEKVPVEMPVDDREGDYGKYKVIVIDGVDYRIPASVIATLKTLLEDKPSMEFFKVVKSGEGMKTQYTVVPL